jgi:hypothetical protein
MRGEWAVTSEGTPLRKFIRRAMNYSVGTFWVKYDEIGKIQRLAGSYATRAGRVTSCKSYPLVDKDEVSYVVFIEVKDKKI